MPRPCDSPVDQHKVLAIDYNDFGNGTATLDIWDNNDVRSCRKLQLDMRESEVKVSSSNPDLNDIKGIICDDYSSKAPPQSPQKSINGNLSSNWSPSQCS